MQQRPPICRSLLALLALAALLVASGCRDTTTAAHGRTVIEFWSGWTGREGQVFQALVDRLASAGLSEQDFVPVSLELCRYRNHLYGLPVLIDGSALFWNKRAFREAGLDPERPPRTLEEVVAY